MSRSDDTLAFRSVVTIQAELASGLTLPCYHKQVGQTFVSTFAAIVQMHYVGI